MRRYLALVLLLLAVREAYAQADDPLAWLESRGDPRAQQFFSDQAASTERELAALPGRARLLERVRALSEGTHEVGAIALAGGRVFYLRQAPGPRQPALCMRTGTGGAERVLVDPTRFDRDGAKASIDWFVPSPDGRHVAYGISLGGSENSVLRVAQADGGASLAFEIDRARFNAELAWHPDGRSFYYARIAAPVAGTHAAGIRLYRHALGRDTAQDELVFAPGVGGARDVPEFAVPSLHVPADSRYAWAVVREGERPEIAVHVTEQRDLAAGKPRWRKVAGTEDEVLAIVGWKDDLYALSKKNAPKHQVLRASAGAATLQGARVALPEGDVVLRQMGLARDALYLNTMEGGVDRLEKVPIGLLGRLKKAEFLRLPFDNSITQLVTHPTVPGALLRLQGWIDPPRIMQVDAKSGDSHDTRMQPPGAPDFSQMDEVRLYAPGHDGTRIPVTLVYGKSTRLTGDNPTILTGYGAFGATQSPRFDPALLTWLERGGVYAIAHVRGGGEYGDAWHRAGRGASKANTIADFISVADFLVRYGFTNPRRCAIHGRGAGAVAAAGAMARRPDLCAAAVLQAPLADLPGAGRTPAGAALASEFPAATLRVPSALSAYHELKDATPYPAVLVTTGLNDARVEPWQAAKLAARLQAASSSGKPVLLRVDPASGHAPASRQLREEAIADVFSFVLWQTGDPAFQATPAAGAAGVAPEASVAPSPASAVIPEKSTPPTQPPPPSEPSLFRQRPQ
jgi:prolyl oligopeptidase